MLIDLPISTKNLFFYLPDQRHYVEMVRKPESERATMSEEPRMQSLIRCDRQETAEKVTLPPTCKLVNCNLISSNTLKKLMLKHKRCELSQSI